jgi:formylglycine-generating enzyme required for sulfatase activity
MGNQLPPRYREGGEIGRGGLGRVVEALDAEIGRTVALKMVLDGAPLAVVQRFRAEGRVTGRLEHPNIIPVYEVGTLPEGGLYYTMKRIRGRDLGRVLKDLRAGGKDGEEFSRQRLLRIFQDVCLGMAYAHAAGVIHRDLKPSNVMIGDFGETLIVDWGLAKEVRADVGAGGRREGGAPDATVANKGDLTRIPAGAELTLAGDILGTPSYMAPEQAEGRVEDVGPWTDIFALGAILYEILTFRAPYEGGSLADLITRVRSGAFLAPSRVEAAGPSPHGAIPADLEAICLCAMAPKREDRPADARLIARRIQLFLDGVTQRERDRRTAEAQLDRARVAIGEYGRLLAEADAAQVQAEGMFERARASDAKEELWAAQDAARDVAGRAVDRFVDADGAIASAAGLVPDLAAARELKAELYLLRFLEAERRSDGIEMRLCRRVIEAHDDGRMAAVLRGDGGMEVRALAYGCDCLVRGREVPPEELLHLGHHPFSGRSSADPVRAPGMPGLEPKGAIRLRIHGPGCAPAPLVGARAWLWKHEERGRRLVPVTPPGPTADGAPVGRLYAAGASLRPEGPGRFLGVLPARVEALPQGSYLVMVERDGYEPLRFPVLVERGKMGRSDTVMWKTEEVPPGCVPVAAGIAALQGDRGNAYSEPLAIVNVPDVFMSVHPVTCAEYAAFLNGLPVDEAVERAPRDAAGAPPSWPGPPWIVPSAARLAADPSLRVRRCFNADADWEADWPVLGVSWLDAMAFAAWKRAVDGRAWIVPGELEWEKSARGVDRRVYPWGNTFDGRWANTAKSLGTGVHPVSVERFPTDVSPYGVRGLGGNARDLLMTAGRGDHADWRHTRGGRWGDREWTARVATRTGTPPDTPTPLVGFRVACAPRFVPHVSWTTVDGRTLTM